MYAMVFYGMPMGCSIKKALLFGLLFILSPFGKPHISLTEFFCADGMIGCLEDPLCILWKDCLFT
jgi:hypothetical protein